MSSVRVRTTLGAVLVVGVVLLLASAAMVVLLRRSQIQDIKTTARFKAEAVSDLLATGSPTDVIRVGDVEEEFVQVLEEGEVIAATPNVSGEPALVSIAPKESEEIDVPFEDDPFLVVATEIDTPEAAAYTILVGRTMETVIESTQIIVRLLLVGLPLLLLVVGAVTWKVVGRALAPVEAIRSEVESISGAELHRRVPESRSGDEIGRLATTMNQMLVRLDDAQSKQRRFVSDASHELRSPVATIRQHAEVALAHPTGTSAGELAQVVLAENLRLQRLVEDLLLLARMDEHSQDVRKESVDLDDVVFQEVERIRSMTDKSIDARSVSAGRVTGDVKQLSRLVGNLLDNAIRHARSAVRISLKEEDDEVAFEVEDDGAGVPEGDRERVFERFIRLQEARDRDSGGSGLGLAIVAEVAVSHGGTARVFESSTGGACIEVRFPRSTD